MSRRSFGVAIGGAALVAAALIFASVLGAGGTETTGPSASETSPTIFAGIRQSRLALGAADAPVTLVEYADLQCPYCALWATDVLPEIVRDYVRTGRVRLVFRGLAFLGPDSETALRAALATAEQDKLWGFVHELYVRQGAENSGWVDVALPAAASRARVDFVRVRRDSRSARVEQQLLDAARAADRAGVRGTPSFELGRTGGRFELVEDGSLETLRARIDDLLAE